ncbi:hypothetical protein JTB14_035196 [Gonioctena quinquepunctata]|nr:hypothetical protein JTB14_035196 [Gonioctena quinquepunctata]
MFNVLLKCEYQRLVRSHVNQMRKIYEEGNITNDSIHFNILMKHFDLEDTEETSSSNADDCEPKHSVVSNQTDSESTQSDVCEANHSEVANQANCESTHSDVLSHARPRRSCRRPSYLEAYTT